MSKMICSRHNLPDCQWCYRPTNDAAAVEHGWKHSCADELCDGHCDDPDCPIYKRKNSENPAPEGWTFGDAINSDCLSDLANLDQEKLRRIVTRYPEWAADLRFKLDQILEPK